MRIAVEGNIGSGKSGCMAALAAAFPTVPCFPEPVEEWAPLLEMYYASPAEWALPFSLKVLLSFRAPAATDTCIVERSPMASRHVFSQLLYNEGVLNVQEWELFKEYHELLKWDPDLIFYVDTPPSTCLDRVTGRARQGEADVDVEYLKKVEFQYANMLRFTEVPVVRFDGTLPPDQLHAQVVAKAGAALKSHLARAKQGT